MDYLSKRGQLLSGLPQKTDTGCIIWKEMYGNGQTIGLMKNTTAIRRRKIRRAERVEPCCPPAAVVSGGTGSSLRVARDDLGRLEARRRRVAAVRRRRRSCSKLEASSQGGARSLFLLPCKTTPGIHRPARQKSESHLVAKAGCSRGGRKHRADKGRMTFESAGERDGPRGIPPLYCKHHSTAAQQQACSSAPRYSNAGD